VVADSPGAKISRPLENCSADFLAHCNPCILLDPKLDSKAPLTTNCRVKRHLMTTKNHKHGSPAEAEPDSTIRAQVLDFQKIMQAFRKNGMLKHV
jgi:hypothetical protein